jgi:uncharacterized protein
MIAFVLAMLLGATSLAPPQAQVEDGLRKLVPPVPTPASFISDARRVLTDDAHAALDAKIRELQAGGYGDIAIAIIPDIGDYSPNQVAVAIYRTWRVGRVASIGAAQRDVGALILIVPKELSPDKKGQCYIAPGTGAEGIITDAASGAICRDVIIPHLRERDYLAALTAGIDALAARLKGDEGLAAAAAGDENQQPPAESNQWFHWWFIPGGIAAMFAGMFGIVRWRRNRPRKCPRCGRQMHRLSETEDNAELEPGQLVEERLKSVDYDVWECQCGEHLILPYRSLTSSYSKCRECHRRTARAKRTVITHATTSASGLADDNYTCKACGATWLVTVTLPRISTSSGGSGSSGGGGGGGSSFGGSGSSSGGGGGGSY